MSESTAVESCDSVPPRLLAAMDAYEAALMANDTTAMGLLFADDPHGVPVVRSDSKGMLVGYAAIGAFRARRGGAPARVLRRRIVRMLDGGAACSVSLFEKKSGGNVIQTQVWQVIEGEWKIVTAHLTYPTPAFDTAIWRVVGNPLVAPTPGSESDGMLAGLGVAVKDLFAVKGYAVGAGNPEYLADSRIQERNAPAVQRLLDAGAHVVGIAQTDEFAYSLAGNNIHYGTPPNPKAPGRISGGSSSGPAAAVATGQADVGLGTDTAGSLRIPGSYEGLWAIRTTHGRVPCDLVHPLSESFDTVGVLARDGDVLRRALEALMPEDDTADAISAVCHGGGLAVAPSLDGAVEPDVAEVVRGFRDRVVALCGDGASDGTLDPTDGVFGMVAQGDAAPCHVGGGIRIRSVSEMAVSQHDLDEWESIFQSVRGFEAWRTNGSWVSRHWDALDPLIAARFERDSHLSKADYDNGLRRLNDARAELRARLGNRVLLIPTASSVAPPADADAAAAERIAKARADTIRLTSLAGVGGLPAVNVPLTTRDGLSCGACLVGPAGSDKSLTCLAVALAQAAA